MSRHLRRGAARITAAVAILVGWYVVPPPALGDAEADRLAARYSFDQRPISPADPYGAQLRAVAPAYHDIRSWISSVGAAVALTDIDGNGRADDTCLVDPRDDSVTVAPAPDTGDRYASLRLDPRPLPYDATMAPMGCVPADYNADGRRDVLVYFWGRSPVIFLRTPGPGLVFVPREVVEPYQIWNTNALTLADVDGDGHTDLVVGNYFRDGARVLDPTAHDDPNLQMQDSMSRAYNGGTNQVLLFHSAAGGADPTLRYTPTDGVFSPEVAGGWTLAAGAQDLTGDGLPELYFGNDFGPDRLLVNHSTPGHPAFSEVVGRRGFGTPKSKVVGRDSFKGMGVAFTDLNADAVPDVLVSNITEPYALQESNFAWVSDGRSPIDGDGRTRYTDQSQPLGLAWGGWGWDIKAPDLDGDGVPEVLQATGFVRGTVNRWPQLQELALTNDELLRHPGAWLHVRPGDDLSGHDPNRLFARAGDGRYYDIADRVGAADRHPARGIAVADIDHDGRLDFAVASQWAQSHLYRNTGQRSGDFVGLRLLTTTGCATGGPSDAAAATPALGAAVTLEVAPGDRRIGQIYPANGHGGVSSDELLFGLPSGGAATGTVQWRDQCGVRHAAPLNVRPGWHTLLLDQNGSIDEVRP
jgi:hypothetical protein